MDCGMNNKLHTIIIMHKSKQQWHLDLHTFMVSFCFLGFIYFHFLTFSYYFCPWIFLLGHTLFTYFFFKYGKHLQKAKVCTILQCLTLVIQNYDSYQYRKLTKQSDHGHADQEHLKTKDPTISSCQSRPTPSPRQVAHQRPSSIEVFSSHEGTQRNGEYCFQRGEE